MKKFAWITIAILMAMGIGAASAQGVYYGSNVTTSATNVPPGAQAPVYTQPNAKITVCGYPATPTNATCTNTASVYSDQALTVAVAQPIVADAQGNFGFWVASGQYSYSVASSSGTYKSTFPLTLTGAVSSSGTAGQIQQSNGAGGITVTSPNTLLNGLPIQEYTTTTNPTLANWYQALHNCQNQVVNVILAGDSRTRIDDIITSNPNFGLPNGSRWGDLLQQDMNAVCPFHGKGLVPVIAVTNGVNTVDGNFWTANAAVVNNPSGATGPYQQGGSGVAALSAGGSLFFTAGYAFDNLNVYCEASGGGLGTWTVTIDGSSAGTCGSASGTDREVLYQVGSLPLTTHTVTLTCSGGPCGIYGAEATVGTVGVSVHNIAVGSAAAEWFGLNPATQMGYSDLIPGGHQLLVLSFIANEPGIGYSTASFQSALTNIIAHERALPSAPSVFVFAPMQDAIGGQAPYYPVLKTVAVAQNTAFLDMRDRVGQAQVTSLYTSDMYHENTKGNAEEHSMIANSIFDALTPYNSQFIAGVGDPGSVAGAPTFGPAKFANGLTSTSDANYVYLPVGAFPSGTSYTVEAWAKTASTGFNVFVGAGSNAGALYLASNSGQFKVGASGFADLQTSAVIADGNWHHCRVVVTPTTLYAYVDGALVGTETGTAAVISPTSGYIGRWITVGLPWAGAIDEVAIFSTAISTGSTYAVPTAPYAGSEASLTDVYHLEGNANSGIIIPQSGYVTLYVAGGLRRIPVGGIGLPSSGGTGSVTSVNGSTSGGFAVNASNPTTTPLISVAVDSSHVLPVNTGSANSYLNGAGTYTVPASSGGSGTVTSVALTMPGTIFNSSVPGSPVTTSGTLAPTLATQNANTVLAGPSSGSAATPTFRALGNLDLPQAISVSTVMASTSMSSPVYNITGAGQAYSDNGSLTFASNAGNGNLVFKGVNGWYAATATAYFCTTSFTCPISANTGTGTFTATSLILSATDDPNTGSGVCGTTTHPVNSTWLGTTTPTYLYHCPPTGTQAYRVALSAF